MLPSRQTVTKYAAVGTSQCGRFLRRIISSFDIVASGASRFRHVENVPPQPGHSPTSANGALRLRFLTSVDRAEQAGTVELLPGGLVVQHLARSRFAEGQPFPGALG